MVKMRMFKRIFSTEFLLLPIYLYNLIQLFLWKSRNDILAITIRILITAIGIPIVTSIIITLAIYHHVIETILRLKHGKRFHSMLDGCDRIWVLKFSSRNIINALYTIQPNNDPNQPQQLLELLKTKYAIIADTHPRYSSIIRSFLGLEYYHKVDLDLEQCIKYMDDYNDMNEFSKLLETYCNQALPKDDTYLWEYYIGRKAIDWHNGRMYPIFMRNHHSLGDGVSLVTLMTTQLLDNGVELMKKKCETYKSILQKTPPKKKSLENFLEKSFYYPTLSDPEHPNLLHTGELSGRKHLIFCGEKPDDHYVKKVKAIKNFYKVAFADVIGTAISASLYDYFAKHEKTPPKNIIAMNPYFLMSSDFNKLVKIQDDGVPITKLGNKFAMGFSKIPINMDTSNTNNNSMLDKDENDLVKRLQAVQKVNDKLKNALDFSFCYWQMRMFVGLPLAIGRHLLLVNDGTICISNVPGNTTSKLTNGCEVTDTFVFANNFGKFGVTITLFTYDERFRIGLLIDKCLIKERQEAQTLGDDIFKYINAMYDHTRLQAIK